jgi:protocatechuate 3,4-dioxygenase beta subunit
MRIRFLWLFLISAFAGIALLGCGTAQQESFGSGWLGVSAREGFGVTPPAEEVASPTVPASGTPSASITVLPALAVLQHGEKTPISVTLTRAENTGTRQVAMSSSLGGNFSPDQGNFEDGTFLTSFTAPMVGSGPTQITALCGTLLGTTSIAIVPPPPVVYQIQIVPAAAAVMQGKSVPVTIRVTDQNGTAIDGLDLALFQDLDGELDPKAGKVADGGFQTTFTAGTATGTCTISALIAGQVGSGTVAVVATLPANQPVYSISIMAAAQTLGQRQGTPVTVRVSDGNGQPVDRADVTLTNSLDGRFEAAQGQTSEGLFSTVFTSGFATGTCTLSATSRGVTATTLVQLNGFTVIQVLPARTTVKGGEAQTLVVLITDERGTRLDKVKVGFNTDQGGTFDQVFAETDEGYAYFTYTAPTLLVPGQEVITAQALGTSGSAIVTIQ